MSAAACASSATAGASFASARPDDAVVVADPAPAPSSPRPDPVEAAAEACTVFCAGPLLEAVQLAGVFNDSKTFVDMPLLLDPSAALAQFNTSFPGGSARNATPAALAAFVAAHFGPVGSDVANCTPADFRPLPPRIVEHVEANASRAFALAVNAIWPQLCRKATPDVLQYPSRHTLLATPHPMIVPGGRFRESYYWDSCVACLAAMPPPRAQAELGWGERASSV